MSPDSTRPAPVDLRGLNAQVIADLARASVPKHTDLNMPGCAPRILWQDKTVTNLEGALPAPLRKRGSAELVDPESFAAYVNAHKGAGTVITGDADEKGGEFRALLDYHSTAEPQWTEHMARMELEPTPEWARWLGVSGRELDQRAFAEFAEDNAVDLVVPEGDAGKGFPTQQELMSVASTLQIKTDVKFASSVKLQNGQVQLGYVETIDGGHGVDGKLTIPERFGLAIAPFRGTPKYLVTARLRYRGTAGRAVFRVEIERPHKIVESAFNDVRAKIAELTNIKPLVGSITPQTRPNI
jgi:uncharacterized protein YfdQ (DUF2303 family)